MNNDFPVFEWDATESAPKEYPMEIIRGIFIFRGEADGGLYIPSGGTLGSGWGYPISNHGLGRKYPLPDRLKIIFFSYAEKQFYKGEFDLPYERILELFSDGVNNPEVFPNGLTLPIYSRMIVGIAPGGVVAVWVGGMRKVEVFFGQAEKVDLDPSRAFALPFQSKEQSDAYIAKQLVNSLTPEERERIRRDGIPFGLWDRYRNRYDWYPTFTEGHNPEDMDISFLNGENLVNWNHGTLKDGDPTRPLPAMARFMTVVDGRKVLFTVNFGDVEIMDAFEALGKDGRRVYLEFEPRMPRTDIRVRAYNDLGSIELKQFVSKP